MGKNQRLGSTAARRTERRAARTVEVIGIIAADRQSGIAWSEALDLVEYRKPKRLTNYPVEVNRPRCGNAFRGRLQFDFDLHQP